MNSIIVPKFQKGSPLTMNGPAGPLNYEIFNIVDEYHTSLSVPTFKWDFNDAPGDLPYIATSLIATMLRNYGIGLAANQCNLPYAVFVMGSMAGESRYVETVVNPEILSREGFEEDTEGCLSYPGVYLKIPRATHIEVKYFNTRGEEQRKAFDGLTARVFQHELDHLNGKRFTEYVSRTKYEQAKSKSKSMVRKQKRQLEQAQRVVEARKAMQQIQQQVSDKTKLVYNTETATIHYDSNAK